MNRIALVIMFVSISVASVEAGIRLNGASGASEKCDALGYRIGKIHNACVRAMRADFCGDGSIHTVDGFLVDFSDPHGVQRPVMPLLPIEAEWNERGAICVSSSVAEAGFRVGGHAAECVRSLPRCSQESRSRALIVTAVSLH